MIQGLIDAAAGMSCQANRQDVIANNLANVNTPGFKRKTASFANTLAQINTGASNIKSTGYSIPTITLSQDDIPGSMVSTGISSNLAIDGKGSFVIQSKNGPILSRNGSFHANNSGILVNSEDMPVFGQRGQIKITGGEWIAEPNGDIRSGGAVIDKLKIETTTGVQADAQTTIATGSIEGSNVNVVEEMVSMITGLRSYEACQRTIQSIDQTMDKVINQIKI